MQGGHCDKPKQYKAFPSPLLPLALPIMKLLNVQRYQVSYVLEPDSALLESIT